MCICSGNETLKELISKHPELPIVFFCAPEVCYDDEYGYYPAPSLKARVGKVLDHPDSEFEQCYTDEDMDAFKQAVVESIPYDEEDLDSEIDRLVAEKLEECNRYWKDCIIVYLDV